MTTVAAPRLFKMEEGTPEYSPRGSSIHQYIDANSNASIAAGTARFKDSDIPFTLWYDELTICHEVEKSFEIIVGDAVHSMKAGDMIWLPAGTSLRYKSEGISVCFFAVSPGDYEAKKPQA